MYRKSKLKRSIALLLAVVMVISVFGFTAHATNAIYGNSSGGHVEDSFDMEQATTTPAAIGITPFASDITDYINITSWDLLDSRHDYNPITGVGGVPLAWTNIAVLALAFTWETNLPAGQTIQNGDTFRFSRPAVTFGTADTTHFSISNADWADFTDTNDVVIGRWRVNANHIEVEFTENAAGELNISGNIITARSIVPSMPRVPGVHDVVFGGISRPVNFLPRVLQIEVTNRNMLAQSSSSTQIRWQLYPNRIGTRELGGHHTTTNINTPNPRDNPLGAYFNIQSGFYVETTLSGIVQSVSFHKLLHRPVDLDPLSPTYGFASFSGTFINLGSHVTRIHPAVDESYSDFRARLQPFQWGIWISDIGVQTFVAYFGTLGVDGPILADINAGFASIVANVSISSGDFDESYRQAIIDWATEVYGRGNVIGGRVGIPAIDIVELFPPVSVDTPITRTMTVTRDGTSSNHNGNGTLFASGGGGVTIVPGTSARLYLEDQETEAMLSGAAFQLQTLQSGEWVNVAGHIFATGADGGFTTVALGAGTYRFVQTTVSSNLYTLDNPLHNSFNATVGAPVSSEFTIVAGATEGPTVTVYNIRTRHSVTFEPGAATGVTNMPVTRTVLNNNTIFNAETPNNGAVSEPSRTGYIFGGWQQTAPSGGGIEQTATIGDIVVTGSMTFTAIWAPVGAPLVTKTSPTPAPVSVGDTIQYVITISNSNLVALPGNFVITDEIDSRVEFLPDTFDVYRNGSPLAANEFNHHFDDGVLTVTLDGLPAAMNASTPSVTEIRFSVETLPASAGVTISNSAVLQRPSTNGTPPPPYEPPPVTTEVAPHAVTFLPGAATGVTSMPANRGVPNGNTILSTGAVPNPQRTGYTFAGWTQTIPAGATGLTSEQVGGINVTQNMTFTAQWTPSDNGGGGGGTSNLTISKSANIANNSHISAGQAVTYTIRVQNTGTAASGNVTVQDIIPAGMTFVADSAVTRVNNVIALHINPTVSGNTLTWSISSIAAGQTVEVSFQVTVDQLPNGVYERTFRNTATVNGSNTNTVTLLTRGLVKNPDRMAVNVGETINWTLRGFHNPTDYAVTNFAIIDRPSQGLNFQSGSLPAFTNGTGITYDIWARVAGSDQWVTHESNISASSAFTFNLPQPGNLHYTHIGIFFNGDVPAGFGLGNEIVFTFLVGDDAPSNTLVNNFFITFDNIERQGSSPYEPTVNPPGGGTSTPGPGAQPTPTIPFSPTHHAYMIGDNEGNIRPNSSITRAEVATIFFRLITDDYRAQMWAQTNAFPDVHLNNWFNNSVSTMTNANVFTGMPDGTFQPDRAITRAEFAVAMTRFFEGLPMHGQTMFPDIRNHWAVAEINAAARMGWVTGMPSGNFEPDRPITRAEAAALVNRILGRLPRTANDLLPGMVTWPDNADTNTWFYMYIQEASNSNEFVMQLDGIHKTWTGLLDPRDWAVLERPTSRPGDIIGRYRILPGNATVSAWSRVVSWFNR